MTESLRYFGVVGLVAVGLLVLSAGPASAQYYGSHGYSSYNNFYGGRFGNFGSPFQHSNYSGPVYHRPSVHYHRIYHHHYWHWTPSQGVHSHGHFHTVPHFVPGHFDYQHGNHIHTNPFYHRD